MNGLEARELRCYVAVAEELHFGRAATRLHIAQPAVSRTVAALEQRLGVQLLDRTTRRVELTGPGAVLLRQARAALAALEAAERLTVRAAQPAPALVVAVKADGDAGLLPAIMRVYRDEPEALPLEPLLVGPAELTASVRDGRADVAIVAAPFDDAGLDCEEIFREPRVAALPAQHPLAVDGDRDLALGELRAGEIARWEGVPAALDDFYRGRDGDSRGPSGSGAGPAVRDLAEALRLIELGRAVTFLPRSVGDRFAGRAIAYRDVAGLSPQRLFVAWPEAARSPALAAFVRVASAAGAAAQA